MVLPGELGQRVFQDVMAFKDRREIGENLETKGLAEKVSQEYLAGLDQREPLDVMAGMGRMAGQAYQVALVLKVLQDRKEKQESQALQAEMVGLVHLVFQDAQVNIVPLYQMISDCVFF